jgi:hypothetical protein
VEAIRHEIHVSDEFEVWQRLVQMVIERSPGSSFVLGSDGSVKMSQP